VRDPSAFQRLRTAYEAALRDQTEGATQDIPIDRSRSDATQSIRKSLQFGDIVTALQLLELGDAKLELPLAAIEELQEDFLARSPSLPAEMLSSLVRRFAWDDAAHPLRQLRPSLFQALDRRLDAERWYHELLSLAEGRRVLSRDGDHFAARLLLRGSPHWLEVFGPTGWILMLGYPLHGLLRVIQQYDVHKEALRDRFDDRRITWCRRQVQPGRMFAVYIAVFASVVPIAAIIQRENIVAAMVAWIITISIASLLWVILRISWRSFRIR